VRPCGSSRRGIGEKEWVASEEYSCRQSWGGLKEGIATENGF